MDGTAAPAPSAPALPTSPLPGPSVLNAGEPAATGIPGDTVILVDGSTFCLSTSSGDMTPGGSHGLYFRDTRVLSRWELRLDGAVAQPLSVVTRDAYTARYVLRRHPVPGRADSTVLVVRERLIGDGLRETITVENLGREPTSMMLVLHVDADFADLFAVKEGRPGPGGAHAVGAGPQLTLTADLPGDAGRGIRVDGSAEPLVLPGVLTWKIYIPARGRWSAEVVAQPVTGGQPVAPRFARGQPAQRTAAAGKLRAWREASTRITAQQPALAEVLRRTATDLGVLQIRDQAAGGTFVAAGAPWFMTLFGRDSLLTAWMALPLDTGLALGTLQTLAAVQGCRHDPFTEEEPGRVLHELRLGPDRDQALGGSHYYGTADATALFVMLLAECRRWGADEAAIRALLPAADAALAWIERHGDRDGDGFVEYQRATDRGLLNQGWKDSSDAITFADGTLAEPPIALCEVQAYVYAAWLARAELADADHDPDTAQACRNRAGQLRQRFAAQFWLPRSGWYALALDRHKRPVDALTSNAAHCLWAGIATDEHAAVLVDRLAGADLDSGFGLRTLSTAMAAYNPMSYHNGSVWPHDTAIAVAGLLRYAHVPGAVPLAHRLATGLLDAAAAFQGRLPELFCGFSRDQFDPPVPYPTSCSPQAWASAAPLLLVRAALGLDPDVPRRTLRLRPLLPGSWGMLSLSGLRLGPARLHLRAHGAEVTVQGLPDGWTWSGGRDQAAEPAVQPPAQPVVRPVVRQREVTTAGDAPAGGAPAGGAPAGGAPAGDAPAGGAPAGDAPAGGAPAGGAPAGGAPAGGAPAGPATSGDVDQTGRWRVAGDGGTRGA